MIGNRNSALLATAKPPPAHQREVDAMLAEVRADLEAGRRSLFKPPPPAEPARSTDPIEQRIVEELALVARHLEQLGGLLAAEPMLIAKYGRQLQAIDLMEQILGHLGGVVGAADKAAAVERISLAELKARLQRKPIRPIAS